MKFAPIMTGQPVRCGVCGKPMDSKRERARHYDLMHRIDANDSTIETAL